MASEPPRVSVPESELPSLKLLVHAEPPLLEALGQSLAKQSPSLDVDAVCRSVAAHTGLALDVIVPIIKVVWRLAFVQKRIGLETDAFLDALETSLRGVEGWHANDSESWTAAREHIARILGPEGTIAVAAKAGELLLEQQLVFCSARTLTDVRPVFDKPAERIRLFLPFHTLAITCHEAGEMREIRIAMDLGDIVRLRKELDRAERKEKMVRESLEGAGLSVIETAQEGDA